MSGAGVDQTVAAPDVPVPPWAELSDEWTSDQLALDYRILYGPEYRANYQEVVTAVTQFSDGSFGEQGTGDGPNVYINDHRLTPAEARGYAAAILQAANLADQIASGTAPALGEERSEVVVDRDEGIGVSCRPFEPEFAGYEGEKLLEINYNGTTEGWVVLDAEHCGQLAELLVKAVTR